MASIWALMRFSWLKLGRNFKSIFILNEFDRPTCPVYGHFMIACAAARGHLGLVCRLLRLADEEQRREALLLASAYGHADVTELLLKHVSPEFRDKRGRGPDWYAHRWGHHTIVGLLKASYLPQDIQVREKRKRESEDVGREGESKTNPTVIDD